MTTRQDAMDRAGETGEVVFGCAPVAVATSDAALLPCPFCGASASGYGIDPHKHAMRLGDFQMPDHPGSYIIEGDCSCGSGLIGATQEEVTARWNARAPSPALPIDFKQATDQGGTEEGMPGILKAMKWSYDCFYVQGRSNPDEREEYISCLEDDLPKLFGEVDDLSALVARLARALRKAAPGNDLAEKAVDYLRRKGLQGSPLRAAPTLLCVADGDAVGGKSGGAA